MCARGRYKQLKEALAERHIANFETLDLEQAVNVARHPQRLGGGGGGPAQQHQRQSYADLIPHVSLGDVDGTIRVGSRTIAPNKKIMLDLWKKALTKRRVHVHEKMVAVLGADRDRLEDFASRIEVESEAHLRSLLDIDADDENEHAAEFQVTTALREAHEEEERKRAVYTLTAQHQNFREHTDVVINAKTSRRRVTKDYTGKRRQGTHFGRDDTIMAAAQAIYAAQCVYKLPGYSQTRQACLFELM